MVRQIQRRGRKCPSLYQPVRHVNARNPEMAALIAEIGLNHLGDVSRAWRTLNGVLEAGANSVTFQIREPKFYETTNSSKRRLPEEFYREAAIAAHKAGCQFGIATCDESLVEGLAAIGVDFWKTLSWDFRN